jgi:acetyl esterase/lipase
MNISFINLCMSTKHALLISAVIFGAIGAAFGAYTVTRTASPATSSATEIAASFDTAKLGTVESDVRYCTVHDVDLFMDVYWPSESVGPFPAAVYVHGGGWSAGDKTQNLKEYASSLTTQGVAVFAINYRLASEYQFPAMIEDVKCAIRSIRANAGVYGIDPDAIGIFGGSAGGHLVSLAGTADESAGWDDVGEYQGTSSAVQAVVDMFGPVDLTVEFEGNSSRSIKNIFGATSFADMTEASPVTYVTPNDPPFLILHGEDGSLVPIAQSETFFAALQSAGVEAEFVRVKNSGHSFRPTVAGTETDPSRTELTEIITTWFVEHLKS